MRQGILLCVVRSAIVLLASYNILLTFGEAINSTAPSNEERSTGFANGTEPSNNLETGDLWTQLLNRTGNSTGNDSSVSVTRSELVSITTTGVIRSCDHNTELICQGDFCGNGKSTCQIPDIGSFGKFQIPPKGNEVDTCVAEGQTVYLTCDRGREIISHSAMSVLEIVCHESKLDLWDAELCVPVKCDFPQDWMRFTDLTEAEFKMKEYTSFQYGSVMSVKCWIPEMGFNWNYLIKCQSDGSWSGIEVLAKDDCEPPHPEVDFLARHAAAVSGSESKANSLQIQPVMIICLIAVRFRI